VTHPLDTGQNRRRRCFLSPVPRAPQLSYFFNPAPKTMRVNSGCATPTPGTPPQNHEPQASLLWALHHRAAARSSLFRSQTPSPLFRSLRIKILDSISALVQRWRTRRAHCSRLESGSSTTSSAPSVRSATLTSPRALASSLLPLPMPLLTPVPASRDALAECHRGLHRLQLVQAGDEDQRQAHPRQVRCSTIFLLLLVEYRCREHLDL
jgi:hypothetical protein